MSVLSRPAPVPCPPAGRDHRLHRWLLAGPLVVLLTATVAAAAVRYAHDDSRRHYLGPTGWPLHGQAAYAIGSGAVRSSPGQRAVPIASLAKVMTAYLVLQSFPLPPGGDGFALRVTRPDVADTRARRARDESIVAVRGGEVLTERQALAALLLPSANNVAVMLARYVAGTVAAFVARMAATARRFGLTQTTYTDPSGFDENTRSTAADQVTLAGIAMRDTTFAALVATRSYRIPVAGTVHNTDRLLGTHGFVGIKTGSDDAAGGCFMFRVRSGDGPYVTGVVLGQHGHNLISAGLYAARQLADEVTADR